MLIISQWYTVIDGISPLKIELLLYMYVVSVGHDVFKPHAHLLRGTLYCLWRKDQEALVDLERVVEWEGLSAEVGVSIRHGINY